MLQDIEKIEYRRGLLEKGKQATDLPVKVWRGSQINAEILRSLHNEDVLNLGGVYRGISLLTTDSETYRRIHRFLCVLDNHIAN